MTKADLAERIYQRLGCTKQDASEYLETVLELMKERLVKDDNIKIAGFGTFETRHKKDRRGRNPQTGLSITISARRIVSFRPSAILKQRINTP